MLTVRETAEALDVSEKTVYRWVAAGSVPHHKVGEQYRFAREELMAWMSSRGKAVPQALLHARDHAPLPPLGEVLRRGGIVYKVGGSTPREAVADLAALVPLPEGVDRDHFVEALLAREELANTGIGEGIAVPHLRHAMPQLDPPSVALGFLAEPVDWHAPDGVPVQEIFLPCSASVRVHLHLMSRIAHAVRDPELAEILHGEGMRADILRCIDRLDAEYTDNQPRGKETHGTASPESGPHAEVTEEA